MADSTWKTYKTAVESFQSFRKLYNLQDTWPAPLYDLLFYIAYMSHTGLSASTITTYISGISTMHKCPVHLLKGYLEVRQLDSNFYLHFDGSDLTRYQFSFVLQRALSFCEVKGHFRPHSFRIGAATEAKRFGIHDDVIKKMGALDVRCLYEIHTIRYLNYLLNISHDSFIL